MFTMFRSCFCLLMCFTVHVDSFRTPGSPRYLHTPPERQNPSLPLRVLSPRRFTHSVDSEPTTPRNKRDAPSSPDDIVLIPLTNDSHSLAMIQWSSNVSDTIIMVTRDYRIRQNSFSNFYVSHDYGKTFVKRNDLLKLGSKQTSIENFYQSQANRSRYIMVDVQNKKIFLSKDDCFTFTPRQLSWSPTYLIPHPTLPDVIAALEQQTKNSQLRITTDFGQSWQSVLLGVASFSWGVDGVDHPRTAYVVQGNSVGKTFSVFKTIDLFTSKLSRPFVADVLDFEVIDDYLFAVTNTTPGKSLSLLVSHKRGPLKKAIFPPDERGAMLLEREYYIADSSEGQAFVAVNHASNHTNLYISAAAGHEFSLSLERIFYYNGQSDVSSAQERRYIPYRFLDFHRVAALRGIYISTQQELIGNNRQLRTVITYDKGGEWGYIEAPEYGNKGQTLDCYLPDCSLHLLLQYGRVNPFLRTEDLLSSQAAPSLLLATGTTGSVLGSRYYGVYMSNTGGATWQMILDNEYYYNFGDHGGVIVAAMKSDGGRYIPTNHLLFSCDEGLTWKKKNFTDVDIYIYGVITEPGENTTIFSIYGDYPNKREWVVIRVDMRKELGRNCTDKDYTTWHPSDERHDSGCLLGRDVSFEKRRRDHVCFNGEDSNRRVVTVNCSCTREDYECDFDYEQLGIDAACYPVTGTVFNSAVPASCPGSKTYTVSRGYRRVSGDTCSGGDSVLYEPLSLSCPQGVSITSDALPDGNNYVTTRNKKVKFSVPRPVTDISSLLLRWDFGDGTTTTLQGSNHLLASSLDVTHQYSKTGDFTVTVSILSPSAPTQYNTRRISVRSVLVKARLHLFAVPLPVYVNQEVTLIASYDNATAAEIRYITYKFIEHTSPSITRQTHQPFVKRVFNASENVTITVTINNKASSTYASLQLPVLIPTGNSQMPVGHVSGVAGSTSRMSVIVGCALGAIAIVFLIGFVYACYKYRSNERRFARIVTANMRYNRNKDEGPSLLDSSDDEEEDRRQKNPQIAGHGANDDGDDQLLIA